jgi:hypothetical protein
MIWLYMYIFPEEWPRYKAGDNEIGYGWKRVGYMRPHNWASHNAGNLIVRKRA